MPWLRQLIASLSKYRPGFKPVCESVWNMRSNSAAVRSKAWVYGHSLDGIAGSNTAGGHGFLSVVSVVCCQVEVSATGRSLVQRSPTDCAASLAEIVGSNPTEGMDVCLL